MDSEDFLSNLDEKKRYLEHNNDVDDPRYQNFVLPIVTAIKDDYDDDSIGLDYGCGTGPVAAKLLRDSSYKVNLYDPFFANNLEHLKLKYKFIICCEVMEHFCSPKKDFLLLHSLLQSGGAIYMKTSIYKDDTDFDAWHYKNDPTHVFFYRKETLEWIKVAFSFKALDINSKFIKYSS